MNTLNFLSLEGETLNNNAVLIKLSIPGSQVDDVVNAEDGEVHTHLEKVFNEIMTKYPPGSTTDDFEITDMILTKETLTVIANMVDKALPDDATDFQKGFYFNFILMGAVDSMRENLGRVAKQTHNQAQSFIEMMMKAGGDRNPLELLMAMRGMDGEKEVKDDKE